MDGVSWNVGERPDGSLYLALTGLSRAETLAVLETLFGLTVAKRAAAEHPCLTDHPEGNGRSV